MKLKYILELIFTDDCMRFSSGRLPCFCMCAYKCICGDILAAEWACFVSLLNQSHEYSKSHKVMAHTLY